ncbi:hypothetical protein [Coralloluteibacterium stylophorae]|uniref:Uncharacterized protein n=1 Tax=Coralloluteibacterium stylophorae TaxID=1776034 RepID=A0A8J7VTW0_9GAMM|nr:hypothetical protein [Coralloluteibacterium stylophorae]MBS7455769.1 hypothetical protein [Coralloluteibacterium stylophorae]
MRDSIVPDSYEAWRHCVQVDCGLRLDGDYVQRRIAALEDPRDFHTQQLVQRWGDPHRQRVVGWFRRALAESAARP